MKHYDLDPALRQAMARHHRVVQKAIGTVANRILGCEDGFRGIGKYEGGVRVNGREIVLRETTVDDDWKAYEDRTETPEEAAVVEAIGQVAEAFRKHGPVGLIDLIGTKSESDAVAFGICDPLRSMFDLDPSGRPKTPAST